MINTVYSLPKHLAHFEYPNSHCHQLRFPQEHSGTADILGMQRQWHQY